jgi:hypothetical protein
VLAASILENRSLLAFIEGVTFAVVLIDVNLFVDVVAAAST